MTTTSETSHHAKINIINSKNNQRHAPIFTNHTGKKANSLSHDDIHLITPWIQFIGPNKASYITSQAHTAKHIKFTSSYYHFLHQLTNQMYKIRNKLIIS